MSIRAGGFGIERTTLPIETRLVSTATSFLALLPLSLSKGEDLWTPATWADRRSPVALRALAQESEEAFQLFLAPLAYAPSHSRYRETSSIAA